MTKISAPKKDASARPKKATQTEMKKARKAASDHDYKLNSTDDPNWKAMHKLILGAINHHCDGEGALKSEIEDWCGEHYESYAKLSDAAYGTMTTQTVLNHMVEDKDVQKIRNDGEPLLRYKHQTK